MARKWVAASTAICVMWLAVLFVSIFAPELRSYSAGGDVTTLPLAGLVAVACAFVATIVVASVGFGGRSHEAELEVERLERERLEARVRDLELHMPHVDSPRSTDRQPVVG